MELIEIITATLNTLLEEVVTLQRMVIILSTFVFVTISYLVGKVLRISLVVGKKHSVINF